MVFSSGNERGHACRWSFSSSRGLKTNKQSYLHAEELELLVVSAAGERDRALGVLGVRAGVPPGHVQRLAVVRRQRVQRHVTARIPDLDLAVVAAREEQVGVRRVPRDGAHPLHVRLEGLLHDALAGFGRARVPQPHALVRVRRQHEAVGFDAHVRDGARARERLRAALRRHVPDAHRAVAGRRHELVHGLVTGGERDARHVARVAHEHERGLELLEGAAARAARALLLLGRLRVVVVVAAVGRLGRRRQVPHAHRVVPAAGGHDALALTRALGHRDRVDAVQVARERRQRRQSLVARVEAPELREMVFAARGHHELVRRRGLHHADGLDGAVVRLDGRDGLVRALAGARRRVVHTQHAVVAARDEPPAGGCDGADPVRVAGAARLLGRRQRLDVLEREQRLLGHAAGLRVLLERRAQELTVHEEVERPRRVARQQVVDHLREALPVQAQRHRERRLRHADGRVLGHELDADLRAFVLHGGGCGGRRRRAGEASGQRRR